jgi:hypothetical protein
VRLAGPRDEPAILDLLLADLEENASAIAPPDIKRITSLIEVGTRKRGGFTLVIDGKPGQPVAVAILTPDSWWWSRATFLREIVLYVAPEARNARAGADLLKYECWLADRLSESQGERVYLLSGVTGTKRIDAKMRLYSRSMNQVGAFYVYPALDVGLSL